MSSRIDILTGSPTEQELVLISAAVLALKSQAQAATAQTQPPESGPSAWQRAARFESISRSPESYQASSLWPG